MLIEPAEAAPRSLRERVNARVESRLFQRVIVALIIVNAVILGLETVPSVMARVGSALILLDRLILAVFVVEIAARIFAQGWRFFTRAWNLFDFLIVGIALVPASGPLQVLRALRVLRVLRLVSVVPQLRFVVDSLLHALPGIGSIAALMVVLFYVFAVMATGLFGAEHAEWFGTIGRSMYTLFQVMTLESWSMGIVRPVMETHSLAWLFFIPFILMATFTVLNLFIAIIVNTMQTLHDASQGKAEAEASTTEAADEQTLAREIQSLREELRVMRELLVQRGSDAGR
ncbi:MAG: ion transporter [Thiotrichales bacterium]